MPSLARRDLFHNIVCLTLTGVVFAVALIPVQSGLFIDFVTTTPSIRDHSGADLWIAAKGWRNLDQPAPFSERKFYQAMAVPGVDLADKNRVQLSRWKPADEPRERIDTKVLETLIELEDGKKLSPGLWVDSFILTSTNSARVTR
jgi:putative ABC transport system permease protein